MGIWFINKLGLIKENNTNNMTKLQSLNITFRCKECLSLQIIYKTKFMDCYFIYIYTKCINEHLETYKIKDITELDTINKNKINCSECKTVYSIFYCSKCYKTFCLNCKDIHIKQYHDNIIKLEDIDNIYYKDIFTKYKNYKYYFEFESLDENDDEYKWLINNLDNIIEESNKYKNKWQNEINKSYIKYNNDVNKKELILNLEKRINNEINFIQLYIVQIKNILKNNLTLNEILISNLTHFLNFKFISFLDFVDDIKGEQKILQKLIYSHFFNNSYSNYEIINIKNIKLLNYESEYNFKQNPDDLKSWKNNICHTYSFDIFYNKNKIPFIIYLDKYTINIMNLSNQKIEKYIEIPNEDIEQEKYLDGLVKYYKNNKNEEYILCILFDENLIYIFNLNNSELIFSLEEDDIFYNIEGPNDYKGIFKSGILFSYNNKLTLLISCYDRILIYDVDNEQLVSSILRILAPYSEDYYFIDKNNCGYIISNTKEKISSLIFPQCKLYKNYINYIPQLGSYKYPRVFEFENNITYLITIFDNNILYIFDFHSGDLIKEIKLMDLHEAHQFLFWNSECLIVPCSNDWRTASKVNIFTEEYEEIFYSTRNMEKVYLPKHGEALIFDGLFGGGIFLATLNGKNVKNTNE